MGKDEESLIHSRKNRQEFITEYGVIPHSIMVHNKNDKALDLSADVKSYGNTSQLHKKGTKNDLQRIQYEAGIFKVSGQGSGSGALSRFPQNIGRFFVKFYSPSKGTIFDPFAGHNSRMELVYSTGRNYVGTDICAEFMKANRKIKHLLEKDNGSKLLKKSGKIILYEKSSASLPEIPSSLADYTITSPPYWDVEYYGPEEEQLGKAKTFDKFMELLTFHIKENFRILKPGSYCTWFVNDFVKNKVFYCYHAELIKAFQLVGFTLHDIVIVDLGNPILGAFVETIKKTKRSAKRHEYAITFKK